MLTPEGVVLYEHRLVSSLTPQFLQCRRTGPISFGGGGGGLRSLATISSSVLARKYSGFVRKGSLENTMGAAAALSPPPPRSYTRVYLDVL